MQSNLVLIGSNKEEREWSGGDLFPESRNWLKEEIMGAKSSRDWLSNWSLGLIGKHSTIKGNAVQTRYKPIYWLKKKRKWGLGDKSIEYVQH